MAIMTLTDAMVLVNGVDLSDHVKEVDMPEDVEMLDATAMGAGVKVNFPGFVSWTITIRFLQDFAAGEVDATLFPLLANTTGFTIEVRPTNAARSPTNPGYNATGFLRSYNPVGGQVAQMLTTQAVFVPGGSAPVLLRSTA